MGDEVKITVIATGFRDQMPERRARMLTVEEAPLISVPVMSLDSWMHETGPAVEAATARFLSQVEDDEKAAEQVRGPIYIRSEATERRELEEDQFFSSHEQLVAERLIVEKVAASAAVENEPVFVPAMNGRNGNGFHHDGPAVENESNFETEHVLPRPKFAELAEEPAQYAVAKGVRGWRIRERFERGGCGGGADRSACDVVRGGGGGRAARPGCAGVYAEATVLRRNVIWWRASLIEKDSSGGRRSQIVRAFCTWAQARTLQLKPVGFKLIHYG